LVYGQKISYPLLFNRQHGKRYLKIFRSAGSLNQEKYLNRSSQREHARGVLRRRIKGPTGLITFTGKSGMIMRTIIKECLSGCFE
jgi:hypothetical protein